MTNCNPRRVGDEYQCACGLTWDIHDSKPPCNPPITRTREQVAKSRNASRGKYEIGKLRNRFFK